MTEPIEVAMAEALYSYLIAAPALTAVPRAAPFSAYTPTVNVAYLDVRPLLTAQPQHFNMDESGSDILRGIFQVDAVMPDGQGQNPGLRLSAAIADRFVIGTTLTITSTLGRRLLRIYQPPDTPDPLKDAAWIRFPVSIPWQLIT